MASPWLPLRGTVVVLVIALALAGCGAPKTAEEPESLEPLPDPIHDERSIVLEFESAGICGPPTTACTEYPFTLPRRALVIADLTWTNLAGALTLELIRDGDVVDFDDQGTLEPTLAAALRLEADPGDYVLRVRPTHAVNDRYVLDASFHEIVPLADRFANARSAAEAHADIAAQIENVPCEASNVDAASTSDNLITLAQVNYTEGQHGELDARDGWLLVTTYGGGGFELVDVSDPLSPVHRGSYLPESGASYDTKWMPDGQTVVVTQDDAVELVNVSTFLNGDGTGDFVLLNRWAYESAGPTDRTDSMHMLSTARIAGSDWVFIARQGNAGITVLKLDPVERTLAFAGRIGNDAFSGGVQGTHDASLVLDEFTGRPVLYVANGEQGWRAFDVSDPTRPQQLAQVLPAVGHFTHSVVAQKVDQRRLVVISEEGSPSILTVYDATDWSLPLVVGTWTLQEGEPTASAHNIQVVDGLLYLAHYRPGVFVFDLRDLGATPGLMEPIAHFESPRPTGLPVPYGAYLNNIWEVIVHRGILYASDIGAGTYVLGFGCLTPGDEAASSRN